MLSGGISLLVPVALLAGAAIAQQMIPDPSICVGPITSFHQCQKLVDMDNRCAAISPHDQTALIACVCTQAQFNAYTDCMSEWRLCTLSDTFDNMFQDIISAWHEKCDGKISFKVTTPAVSTLPATVDQGSCASFIESCAALSTSSADCKSSYAAAADLSSCRCQSDVLSIASVCEYDGSVSCLAETPILSNMWSVRFCGMTSATRTTSVTGQPTSALRLSAGGTASITPGPTSSYTPTFSFSGSTSTTTPASGAPGACREYGRCLTWAVLSVLLAVAVTT